MQSDALSFVNAKAILIGVSFLHEREVNVLTELSGVMTVFEATSKEEKLKRVNEAVAVSLEVFFVPCALMFKTFAAPMKRR